MTRLENVLEPQIILGLSPSNSMHNLGLIFLFARFPNLATAQMWSFFKLYSKLLTEPVLDNKT